MVAKLFLRGAGSNTRGSSVAHRALLFYDTAKTKDSNLEDNSKALLTCFAIAMKLAGARDVKMDKDMEHRILDVLDWKVERGGDETLLEKVMQSVPRSGRRRAAAMADGVVLTQCLTSGRTIRKWANVILHATAEKDP